MELSPSWEATSRSATQDFPNILWNSNVHCRVLNSPPLVPVPSQMNPVHIAPSYFSKIQLNIILHLRPGLLSGLFRLSHQNPMCIPPPPMRANALPIS
jgi:hypothetical protein